MRALTTGLLLFVGLLMTSCASDNSLDVESLTAEERRTRARFIADRQSCEDIAEEKAEARAEDPIDGGGFAAGFAAGMREEQLEDAYTNECMGERGWVSAEDGAWRYGQK